MYKTTNNKSDEIIRLYKSGSLLTEICKETTSSQSTVKKVLSSVGIDYDKEQQVLYQQKLDKAIEMYKNGASQITIEKELKLTRKTIRNLLKSKADIDYRTKSDQQHIKRKTKIDKKVFDVLTPDSLYWIGMLYADGHIEQKREASIDLVLHTEDVNHLEKFKEFTKSNRPIKKLKSNCSRIRINSVNIRDVLVKYGFTHNKSTTICPHPELRESRDFWRGVLDGDGGVYSKNDSYGSHQVFLCGTFETIYYFIRYCEKFLDLKIKKPTQCKGQNLYQIHYYGDDAIKIADHLYKDSTTYLERKYNKYLEIIK